MAVKGSMTSVAAAAQVLKRAGAPLTVDEVWERIQRSATWTPPQGGTNPRQTLAVQMARASEGYAGSRPTRTKLFRRLHDGRFELLR